MSTWVTKDGTILKIKEMETEHILNCIKMLKAQVKELSSLDIDFIDASGDTDGTWDLGGWDVKSDISRKKDKIKKFKKELKNRAISSVG